MNTNGIRPPIAPIGLDYVAEALSAAGHRVEVLDLCWEPSWEPAIARCFARSEFGLVGVSVRNTDDCSLATRESFLPGHAGAVNCIRGYTDAPIVLGGVGFSVMPEEVLARCGADAGIAGDGEFAFVELASRIANRRGWDDLPGLVLRKGEGVFRNPASFPPLSLLPPMSRSWVDNPRYFREGGQAGFETKRSCPLQGASFAGSSRISISALAQYTRSRFPPLTSETTDRDSSFSMARCTVVNAIPISRAAILTV